MAIAGEQPDAGGIMTHPHSEPVVLDLVGSDWTQTADGRQVTAGKAQ